MLKTEGLKKGKFIKAGESWLLERHYKNELVLYDFPKKKWLNYDVEVQKKNILNVKRLFKVAEKKTSWLEAETKQIQMRNKAQFCCSISI